MMIAEIKRVLTVDHQIFDGPQDEEITKGFQTALESLFRANEVKGWEKWKIGQRVVAAKQLVCKLDGIDPGIIDGIFGHLTDFAITAYDAQQTGKPLPNPAAAESLAPLTPPPPTATKWPRQTPDRAEIIAFYGKPGTNQTRLQLPYPLYYGPTKLATIGLHLKVHDPVLRILTSVLKHYGLAEIKKRHLDRFSGALNVRKIRGGNNWSMHSWGVAFDFDAADNGMNNHCHDKETPDVKPEFCAPEYKFWFDAWEAEGAVCLGRARDYDFMHTQFARL